MSMDEQTNKKVKMQMFYTGGVGPFIEIELYIYIYLQGKKLSLRLKY